MSPALILRSASRTGGPDARHPPIRALAPLPVQMPAGLHPHPRAGNAARCPRRQQEVAANRRYEFVGEGTEKNIMRKTKNKKSPAAKPAASTYDDVASPFASTTK